MGLKTDARAMRRQASFQAACIVKFIYYFQGVPITQFEINLQKNLLGWAIDPTSILFRYSYMPNYTH